MARCPECEARFPLDEDELEEGDFVNCVECGCELEVTDLDPLRFEAVPDDYDEGDDYSDDDLDDRVDDDMDDEDWD